MTHDDLVRRAVRWLKGTMHCEWVVSERSCALTGEIPDAFGVNNKGSILIECKTSVGDYYADRAKHFRKFPEKGLGRLRYYMVPKGLIDISRRPLPKGWGLLEVLPKTIRVIKHPEVFIQTSAADVTLMRNTYMVPEQLEGDICIVTNWEDDSRFMMPTLGSIDSLDMINALKCWLEVAKKEQVPLALCDELLTCARMVEKLNETESEVK